MSISVEQRVHLNLHHVYMVTCWSVLTNKYVIISAISYPYLSLALNQLGSLISKSVYSSSFLNSKSCDAIGVYSYSAITVMPTLKPEDTGGWGGNGRDNFS